MRSNITAALVCLLAVPVCALQAGQTKIPAASAPVSEEMHWTLGETTIAATITIPNGPGPFPAVVFVAGSGPTDRNWTSPLLPGSNGSAALLADELAKAGFATLRYDKRFTGPYGQANWPLLKGKLSMQSHVDELASSVSRLKEIPAVDKARIFALTNSEGAFHALNYQLQTSALAGLILAAPPGREVRYVLRQQIAAQVAALPNAKEIMAGLDKLIADFVAEKPFAADPALPGGINNLIGSFSAPENLPFAREWFTLDPAALFARITAPALVVIGKKDIQVDWQVDGPALEKAAAGQKNKVFSYPADANHVLKHEPKPRAELTAADGAAYNAAGKVLDEETVRVIKKWLLGQAAPKK